MFVFFFFKQKTAYEMRISDWSSDVCSSDLPAAARTDAEAADLLTSDVDANDTAFCTGERTAEGFFKTRNGLDQAISRGLARSEERRVGKECVSKFRYRRSPYH